MNPPKPVVVEGQGQKLPRKVVYVPACVTRIMGPAKDDYETGQLQWLAAPGVAGDACCGWGA